MVRIVFGIGVLALIGFAGCRVPDASGFQRQMVNQPAPDFELTALDGSKVKLSDFRGKPVLVSFWGLGCPPCRAEAPHLSRLAEQYVGEGLVILSINAWDDDKKDLESYAKKEKLAQRILLNGSAVADQYHVEGLPTTLWIDRKGIVVDTEVGFGGVEALRERTRKLTASSGS